jgi:ATP-dependent protease Clp ATPase subunit
MHTLFVFLLVNQTLSANANEINMSGPNTPDISTLQVKKAIQKKHEGEITSIEKKATAKHPNCHIVKMKTDTNGLKYIRYACN